MSNADLTGGEQIDTYPHEIHLTVAPPDNPRLFFKVCRELEVRPCVFDNELANGQHATDFLTASEYDVTTEDALTEMRKLGQVLVGRGLSVVREKIETSPTNPLTPKRNQSGAQAQPNSYFETHFDVHEIGHSWSKRLDLIQYMGPEEPVLLSVNRDKFDEFLATYRVYDTTHEEYMERFNRVKTKLANRYEITPAETEFAVYDSNPQHDRTWYDSYKHMIVNETI